MRKILLFLALVAAIGHTAEILYQTPDGSRILLLQPKGKAFFVDAGATTAAATNSGRTPTMPLTTIALAVAKCTANSGDVIYVLPGHTETVTDAATLSVSKAGIQIIGLGSGAQRPTITLGTSTDATVSIDAASVTLKNICFRTTKDAVKIVLDINSTDATIEDCDFRDHASYQPLVWIDVNGGGANAADRCVIKNCRILSTSDGPNGGIELGEVADGVQIIGCFIDGDFADACIHNPTGKTLTNLLIKDCVLRNRDSGEHAIELVSACTGQLVNCRLCSDSLSTILDPGSLFCLGNLATAAIDVAGVAIPVAAGAALPADSVDATAIKDAAIDAATFAASAIDATAIADSAIDPKTFTDAVGTHFWVTKTLTSSNIKKDTTVAITGSSSGGALAIKDIILQTDGTGLAAGTNFQIKNNNASGAALTMVETVASLGASKTVHLAVASVSYTYAVLESGKALVADSTGADCTGGGTITIYVKFERLAAAATVAAAP